MCLKDSEVKNIFKVRINAEAHWNESPNVMKKEGRKHILKVIIIPLEEDPPEAPPPPPEEPLIRLQVAQAEAGQRRWRMVGPCGGPKHGS